MRDDRTRRATEVSQPPIVVACVAEDLAFMPTARRRAREAIIRPPQSRRSRWGATTCDAQAGRALGLMASGATCVQRLDGSRDSAIHTKYRISLRSSSMREPRYPLPRVVLTYLKMTTPPAHTVSGRRGRALSFKFLGAIRAGVRCTPGRGRPRERSATPEIKGRGERRDGPSPPL
ncbi:unnamed protein product [Prunus brigantina]